MCWIFLNSYSLWHIMSICRGHASKNHYLSFFCIYNIKGEFNSMLTFILSICAQGMEHASHEGSSLWSILFSRSLGNEGDEVDWKVSGVARSTWDTLVHGKGCFDSTIHHGVVNTYVLIIMSIEWDWSRGRKGGHHGCILPRWDIWSWQITESYICHAQRSNLQYLLLCNDQAIMIQSRCSWSGGQFSSMALRKGSCSCSLMDFW